MAELLVATGSGADSGVAGSGSAFSFSLSSVFFVFSSATSSSSSVFSLLSPFLSSSLSFSRSPPSSVLSLGFFLLSFLLALPCIYRKTGEGDVLGWPLLAAPSTTVQWIERRRQVGELWASYCIKAGKESRRKEKKKNDSSPLFSARPVEKDDGAVSKRHRFAFFFVFFS